MIDTLKALVVETAARLSGSKRKIVTAESCTGGGLAYWLTSVSGSSAWFERGFVTYSNEAKQEMLSVRADTILAHGAVSQEVALEMAAGALRFSRADLAVAITGIAGPEGGTNEKPVGMVWIACGTREGIQAKLFQFSGDRQSIRIQAMIEAVRLISFSLS